MLVRRGNVEAYRCAVPRNSHGFRRLQVVGEILTKFSDSDLRTVCQMCPLCVHNDITTGFNREVEERVE